MQPIEDAFDALHWFSEDLRTTKLRPWTLEEFSDSYNGSQYTRYKKAVDSLRLVPLTKRDCRVSTFVKCEKTNFAIKDDPAPRVIQPRDPRFNAAIGRFIKPLEKIIYKQLGKLYKHPCVAKGFDIFQTGDIIHSKWNMFKNPCAISLDASRFDQHCSVDALKWSHDIYRLFCDDQEFSWLLNMMLYNKGHGTCKDGYVKYEVAGRRMSGDMDTALGNCLLMVAMTYSLCKKLDIEHEVIDNGDDITVILDAKNEQLFRDAVPEWYSKLGFKMKIEPTIFVLEQLEFCQMHPVFDGEEWRMVRNLVALSKDLVCTTNQEQMPQWLQAIGEGGVSLTSGMPVYQEFYLWLQKFGNVKRNKTHKWKLFQSSGFFRLSRMVQRKPAAVTPLARESFCRAFGMPFNQQMALERMYQDLSLGPLGIDHSTIDSLTDQKEHSSHLFTS